MLDTIFFVCTSQRQNHYTSPPPHVRESSHLMPPIPPPSTPELRTLPSTRSPWNYSICSPKGGGGMCHARHPPSYPSSLLIPHRNYRPADDTARRISSARSQNIVCCLREGGTGREKEKISFAVCAREGERLSSAGVG